MTIGQRMVEIAIDNGATLAGIASVEALKASASGAVCAQLGGWAGIGAAEEDDAIGGSLPCDWPDSARSILVIGLSHPEDKPELDWWDGSGTPGNRILIDIVERTSRRVEEELNVRTRNLPYYVEGGGVFLKDAAVLAGLGCIGKSNLLITPSTGPRIRLRAQLIDAEIDPTGPMAFDPCADCKVFCRRACPEDAMAEEAPIFESINSSECLPARDGAYDRDRCNVRMEKDVAEGSKNRDGRKPTVRYCRRCEFACPAGR